jgi:hypothetical protein
MKTFFSKSMLLVALAATFLSFTYFGGEGFEIYLNNKVVIQKFGTNMNTVQRLNLSSASPDDNLVVKYHHCGKVGKNRVITIKDANDKTLKEWRFADVAKPVAAMQCKVKDIINLHKKGDTELRLYYTSSELPAGRQLTSIVMEKQHLAVNP